MSKKKIANTLEQEMTKPKTREEDLITARQDKKTKEAQGGERKL